MAQEIIRIDLEGVNSYLLKTGDGFILVDTGGHLSMDKQFTSRREKLEKELEIAGCRPGNLKLVILTHGDNDHTANAAYLREKYNTKIAMHSGDLELVENPDMEIMMGSFRYRSLIYNIVFLFVKKQLWKITQKVLDNFEKFKPDIFLGDGQSLSEFGFEAKVLHIPGHTKGSIGILAASGEFISGDTFANIGKPAAAPNAVDFKMLNANIERLKKMNITTVYPGHGEPFEAKLLT